MPRLALVLAAAWIVVAGALFQSFFYWDWEHGLRRGAVLLALGGLCCALFVWTLSRRVTIQVPRAVQVMLVLAALAAVSNSIVRAVHTFDASRRVGDVFLDQGQINYRALRLLKQRINPYGTRTMLDPVAFHARNAELSKLPDCGQVDLEKAERSLGAFWDNRPDPDLMVSLFPTISDSKACSQIRSGFQSLGFHYGPVLLLSYLPFVALLGPAGIYLVHLAALLTWLFTMALYFKSRVRWMPWLVASSVTVLFLLLPSHVSHNFLQFSASDLVPVVLASLALLCWLDRRESLAAILLALSVDAKLLPGVLFVPLLARDRRATLIFIGVATLFYIPFLLWEPKGLLYNLTFPFTVRQMDSTAPLFYLPSAVGTLIKLSVVAVFGNWIWRLRRQRWPEHESLLLLVLLHLAVLGSGSVFHNNYVIWAMAVVAIFWVRLPDKPLSAADSSASYMAQRRPA